MKNTLSVICLINSAICVHSEALVVSIIACCTDCTIDQDVLRKSITVREDTGRIAEIIATPEFNITYVGLSCPSEDVVLFHNDHENRTFDLFQDGHLWGDGPEGLHVPLLSADSYCVEENGDGVITAKACFRNPCRDGVCLHKCCPDGYSLDLLDSCVLDEGNAWERPTIFVDAEMNQVDTTNESISVLKNYLPKCDYEKGDFLAVYGLEEVAETIYFMSSGGIVVASEVMKEVHTKYCSDHVVENGTTLAHNLVLVCTQEAPVDQAKQVISHLILPIMMQISALFLLLTFVVYAILPELRSLHGKSVMCHVAALWVNFTLMGVLNLTRVGNDPDLRSPCIIVGIFTHFAFLSAFTWLSVMGFDICWTFRHPHESNWFWDEIIFGKSFSFVRETEEIIEEPCAVRSVRSRSNDTKKFVIYSLIAWGTAGLIAAIGVIADLVHNHIPESYPSWFIRPGFGEWSCWFHKNSSSWLYMYGPLTVMLLFNITMFALTAPKIYEASKNAAMLSPGDTALAKERLRAIVKLSVLMGLTWIMEAVSFAIGGEVYYWFVTDLVNIFMPVVIFFLFVWKQKIFEMLATRYSFFRRIFGRKAYKRPASYTQSTNTTSLSMKSSGSRPPVEEEQILPDTNEF